MPGRSPDGSHGTVAAFYGSGGPDVNNIRLLYNVTFGFRTRWGIPVIDMGVISDDRTLVFGVISPV